ncbi:competence protein ComGB [Ligilactobacillus salitolerans]|uniref:Competence protein ComGB n=1 Tax=Ligilactobacillus salitolerans TaxID=1808352 RepID=A0A401ISU1_9LACO|nr:competence protein ComGB [Ligilactobacillus salitolerans]
MKEQADFFNLLADLLQAGFSLKKSLENMQLLETSTSGKISQILAQLEAGATLSSALSAWISATTCIQLRLAEQHGEVERSIRELGKFLLRESEQLKKIKGLLFYPCMLLVLLAGICVSIKIWLLPQLDEFTKMSSQQDTNLGGFDWTRLVQWSLAFIGILLFLYLFKVLYWWSRQKALSRHLWYSQLPIFGKLYCSYSAYLISLNLSLMFKSGLNLQEICQILISLSSKTLYHQLGLELANFLEKGRELNSFIQSYPFIPQELLFFLNNGDTLIEQSNELLIFSENSYRHLLRQADHLLTWLQPLLFFVIALIIIGTYLIILLPMYSSIGGIYQ